jgi:glutathione synthase/RimK-type ligase-like ATP-grasp enzyme
MSRIMLATCGQRRALTASDELLALHLRLQGANVAAVPWDEIVLADLDGVTVCLRSTWDYHKRSDEFRDWIGDLQARHVSLINPAETVLWNLDKAYLGWLEAHGITIPATRWIPPGEPLDLPGMLASTGWDRAVLKPRISATAYGTHLVSAATTLDHEERRALSHSGALLQAFVPEIQSMGEMSLMFIDGSFTHAVRKRPAPGDFRVQHEFGGTVEPVDAPAALQDFGASVLETIPLPWTFARVDLVDTMRGPVLMELELIEPDLFFTPEGNASRHLAAALCAAGSR